MASPRRVVLVDVRRTRYPVIPIAVQELQGKGWECCGVPVETGGEEPPHGSSFLSGSATCTGTGLLCAVALRPTPEGEGLQRFKREKGSKQMEQQEKERAPNGRDATPRTLGTREGGEGTPHPLLSRRDGENVKKEKVEDVVDSQGERVTGKEKEEKKGEKEDTCKTNSRTVTTTMITTAASPSFSCSAPSLSPQIIWQDKSITRETLEPLLFYQRINHFLGMHAIARKAQLFSRLMKLLRRHIRPYCSQQPREEQSYSSGTLSDGPFPGDGNPSLLALPARAELEEVGKMSTCVTPPDTSDATTRHDNLLLSQKHVVCSPSIRSRDAFSLKAKEGKDKGGGSMAVGAPFSSLPVMQTPTTTTLTTSGSSCTNRHHAGAHLCPKVPLFSSSTWHALKETLEGFVPESFSAMSDRSLLSLWEERATQQASSISSLRSPRALPSSPLFFIIKPNTSCEGKGIRITPSPTAALTEEEQQRKVESLIQAYVDWPLLIEGKKFDLRIYVLLTSVCPPLVGRENIRRQKEWRGHGDMNGACPSQPTDPTEILKGIQLWVHSAGMVRMCALPYAPPTLCNCTQKGVHLTNYAVNKKLDAYRVGSSSFSSCSSCPAVEGVETTDLGHKRDLYWLENYINHLPQDTLNPKAMQKLIAAYGRPTSASSPPTRWECVQRAIDECITLTFLSGIEPLRREYRTSGRDRSAIWCEGGVGLPRKVDQKIETRNAGQNEKEGDHVQALPHSAALPEHVRASKEEKGKGNCFVKEEDEEKVIQWKEHREKKGKTTPEDMVFSSFWTCASSGCFELLGLDIMLCAETLQPVLMEVNHSPSLFCETPFDARLKKTILTDVFHLLGHTTPSLSYCNTKPRFNKAMLGLYEKYKKASVGEKEEEEDKATKGRVCETKQEETHSHRYHDANRIPTLAVGTGWRRLLPSVEVEEWTLPRRSSDGSSGAEPSALGGQSRSSVWSHEQMEKQALMAHLCRDL